MPSAEVQTSYVVRSTVGHAADELGPPTAAHTRATWPSRLLTGLLLAVGLTVLALGVTIRVADLHLNTVLSNSMQPTFSAGDMVVTKTVPTSSLAVGDVITFVSPTDSRVLIHRITSLQNGVITTRGDANSIDDPWHLTISSPAVNRLVAVVPYVGWLTELQRPALLLAGALVGLIVLLELRKEVSKRLAKTRTQPQS
jgi:signal peptidase I, archaeal type